LREECRLRVFENRVLRRILGLQMDEVKERKKNCVCNEELTDTYVRFAKYYLGDQIKKNDMGKTCSIYGGDRCVQGFDGET
jgi:hypothetical protein